MKKKSAENPRYEIKCDFPAMKMIKTENQAKRYFSQRRKSKANYFEARLKK